MEWFPFFTDIEAMPCLIVGGGTVALRKTEKLLPFHPKITVAAPEICPELQAMERITLRRETFREDMLEGMGFVIAATDDRDVNAAIAAQCRRRGIPVNAVDSRADCSFLFPALVKRGPLTVGISTGGASPTAAALLREQLEQSLPENVEELLQWLDSIRPTMKERLPEETDRAKLFRRLTAYCFTEGRIPGEAVFEKLLQDAENK